MEKAFIKGFALELIKLAAPVKPAAPVPWHKQIPGARTGRFALKMAPLAALAGIPLWALGKGLGTGLARPAAAPQAWEERY